MSYRNLILAKAERVFGEKGKAVAWLSQPRPAFGNRSAIEIACDDAGYQKVKEELSRLEHGFVC
ncbi:antitoxin Xre/MbcA/ParS toxin-binding domain-containing protein [Pseudomonas promysalinigenes]|uniref:antitoxin Xre/MbcA/ParS toxin-binding domain-containing protein n=1 Tax=Pseudomonas promysalinigenes TaxID=485898 RepID=UPI003F9EFBA4